MYGRFTFLRAAKLAHESHSLVCFQLISFNSHGCFGFRPAGSDTTRLSVFAVFGTKLAPTVNQLDVSTFSPILHQ